MIGSLIKKILSSNKSASNIGSDEKPNSPSKYEENKKKANDLMDLGQFEEAALYFGYAIDGLPTDSDSYAKKAFCFKSTGKKGEAMALLEGALQADSNNASAYFLKGLIQEESGLTKPACDSYKNAIRVNHGYELAYLNLSRLEFFLGKVDDALSTAQQGLGNIPASGALYSYMGNIYKGMGNFAAAFDSYKKALGISPSEYEFNFNLGVLLQESRQWDKAVGYFDVALQAQGNHDAIWSRSLSLLLLGRYPEGFSAYESRLDQSETPRFSYLGETFQALPKDRLWKGESLAEKTLLVWTEQGLGDSLMAMRYLSGLKSRFSAEKLVVCCEPSLINTMRCISSVDQVVSKESANLAQYDFHCSLFSLPHHFATTFDSIPDVGGYLELPLEIENKWKHRVASFEGLKVGFAWSGSKQNEIDSKRSVSLEGFMPLIHTPGVKAFNLQFPSIPGVFNAKNVQIVDWMAECSDVLETLGLINSLDLVICVDTSVIHMAGALGKEAWLLNRHESEWRWSTGNGIAPWYRSVSMFTQPQAGDWKSVIEALSDALAARIGIKASPTGTDTPTSPPALAP